MLVPGDLVLLEAGDGVRADIRVILGNVNPVKVLHDSSLKFSTRDSSEKVLEVGGEIDALQLLLLSKRSRIGQAEYEAVKLGVIRAVQTLACDTRVAYYRVLAAEQRLAMQQSIRQAAEAADDMAGRLREAGNIRLLDKLNRQALYAQALLDVSAAEFGVIEAREDLNVLMGLSGSQAKWQTSGYLPRPPEDTFVSASIETNAIQNSFQLAITRERIRAAAERLNIASVESVIPAMHLGVDAEREPDGLWFVGPMISFEPKLLPETTVLVQVGSAKVIEFVADNPGDWLFHCHMTHHTMNQMGHDFPNMVGPPFLSS